MVEAITTVPFFRRYSYVVLVVDLARQALALTAKAAAAPRR